MSAFSRSVLLAVVAMVIAFSSAAQCASSTDFFGLLQVHPSFFKTPAAADPFYWNQHGSVILTRGEEVIRGSVRSDGVFCFKDVPFGSYLLQADFYDFVFPTVRVDVQFKRLEGREVPTIRAYRNEFPVVLLRGLGVEEESPVVVPTEGLQQFYIPREVFSLRNFVMNPAVLVLGFGLITVLMSKMIPEEELKKSRAQTKDLKNALLNPTQALENAASTSSKKKQ